MGAPPAGARAFSAGGAAAYRPLPLFFRKKILKRGVTL